MDALFARQAELQDIIDATDAWNLDSKLERAMDALRCPPEDQLVKNLSGGERRRVALCRLLFKKRTSCCSTSRPTTWMQKALTGWNSTCSSTKGTVIAVNTTATSWIMWLGWFGTDRGEGILGRKLFKLAGAEDRCMEMEERRASKRRKTLERELEWVRMAP